MSMVMPVVISNSASIQRKGPDPDCIKSRVRRLMPITWEIALLNETFKARITAAAATIEGLNERLSSLLWAANLQN
jgi:hypothetical protein